MLTGGMWAWLGLRCGVSLPLHAVEHHYVVSQPIRGAFDELPVGRDPDLCPLCFRAKGIASCMPSLPGGVEGVAGGLHSSPVLVSTARSGLGKVFGALGQRSTIPGLETSGFQKFVNGPKASRRQQLPDGETPELRNLFVACGFNSVGIAPAPGRSRYGCSKGQPSLDLWSVDVRRFGPWANNQAFLRARVVEVPGLHYQMAWPNQEPETARNVRESPLHSGSPPRASFQGQGGWERAWLVRRKNSRALRPRRSST